jgi:NADPH2:quinone reductase
MGIVMAEATMKAVVMTAKGGPEVLRIAEVPLGWPRGPHDVLVRLKAAGINPADLYFREAGTYLDSDRPRILGSDGAGVVEEVGAEVRSFLPGEEVAFCYGGIGGDPGTYAEFAVVPAHSLARKAAAVSFAEAAAAPLVSITCGEALYQRANLESGETCLIHAGAGGTGHVAIQLAKLRGAKVATTVSGADKAAFVTGLGADCVIDYRKQDVVEAVRAWTDGRGLDVALDNVGADALLASFRAMAPYGRVVTLMGMPGDTEETDAYNKNLTVHNVMMLTPMWLGLDERVAQQGGVVHKIMEMLGDGRLKVTVAETFPLKDAARAHERLAKGGMIGKIVLEIG